MNLRRIAVLLKAGVQERSNYRRIRRFLADYEVDYAALSELPVRLVPQEPPYALVLDRTEWHFSSTLFNVPMIGITHRGIAFPVAWTALPKSGSSKVSSPRLSGSEKRSRRILKRSAPPIIFVRYLARL